MNLHIISAWFSNDYHAGIFLIPCPFKYLTGIDCPGCGFQRSLLLLLKGEFQKSIHMYPAGIPILFTIATVLTMRYVFKRKNDQLIKILYLFTGSIILISYVLKMFGAHIH